MGTFYLRVFTGDNYKARVWWWRNAYYSTIAWPGLSVSQSTMEETDSEIQAIETLYQEIASLDSHWRSLQTHPSPVHHDLSFHLEEEGECHDLDMDQDLMSEGQRQSVIVSSRPTVTYLGMLPRK